MKGVSTINLCGWEASEAETFHLESCLAITKGFKLDIIDEEAWA